MVVDLMAFDDKRVSRSSRSRDFQNFEGLFNFMKEIFVSYMGPKAIMDMLCKRTSM